MPLEITDPSKTYQLTHPSGAVFTMKHWTLAMQEVVDRECFKNDEKGGYKWDITRERSLKIDLCIEDWSEVNSGGSPLPCTEENKKSLPVGIMVWLVKDIDVRAGLRMPDAEKKN